MKNKNNFVHYETFRIFGKKSGQLLKEIDVSGNLEELSKKEKGLTNARVYVAKQHRSVSYVENYSTFIN
jgi:hypothetical protein